MHKEQRDNLCKEQLKEAHGIKTPDWTGEDLKVVLKQLKNNKS